MAEEVKLPQLGESVTEGTITAWLVDEGETVEEDQPLFEISTDKIDTEVPSPASGVLQEIRAQVDDTIEVGEVVAIIATEAEAEAAPEEEAEEAAEGEEPSPEAEGAPEEETEEKTEEAAEDAAEEAASAAGEGGDTAAAAEAEAEAGEPTAEAERGRPAPEETGQAARPRGDGEARGELLSPIVRKMVAEHDLDVDRIQGSGKGGRITREDVQQAIASGAATRTAERPAAEARRPEHAAPAPRKPRKVEGRSRTEKLSRIRASIAKHMWESLQTTAQLTAAMEVDVTSIMKLREEVKEEFRGREGVPLSPLPFLARAACMTLPDHESLNAAIDVEEGTATYYQFVNLGIAVDTEAGLIVPNIKQADDLTVPALAREIVDLAERARSRNLQPDDVAGGTFTITNTGSRGVLFDTPILNPPEVAILATPKIEKRPIVVDDDRLGDTLAIRHMTYLCLTYDHRMVDGADAARFLADLKDTIETHDWASEVRA